MLRMISYFNSAVDINIRHHSMYFVTQMNKEYFDLIFFAVTSIKQTASVNKHHNHKQEEIL